MLWKLKRPGFTNLRSAQNTPPKAFVLTNGRGQITWCNDAFCDMTGFRFGELEGKTLLQMTRNPNADQAELDRLFSELRMKRPADFEILASRKDKSDFWMNGSITPIIANGAVKQVVHVLNDVTEEREMRDRLAVAQKSRIVSHWWRGMYPTVLQSPGPTMR